MKRLLMFVIAFVMMIGSVRGDDKKFDEEKKKSVVRALLVAAPYSEGRDMISGTIMGVYWNLRGTGVKADEIIVLDDIASTGAYPVSGMECIENIRNAFDAFAEVSTDDDMVIMHFAGHGHVAQDGGGRYGAYFYIKDSNGVAIGLTDKELKWQLARIKARRILVSLDSCWSGIIANYVGGDRIIAVTPCTGYETSHYNFSQLFIATFYQHLCAGSTVQQAYAAGRLLFEKQNRWDAGQPVFTLAAQSEYKQVDQTPLLVSDHGQERIFNKSE